MVPFEIVSKDGVLRIALHGYWDVETARRYIDALGRHWGVADPARCWLIDASDFHVQSKDVSAIIQDAVVAEVTRDPPRRIALVENSALVAIQARRVAKHAGHRDFSSVAEAEAWLTGP